MLTKPRIGRAWLVAALGGASGAWAAEVPVLGQLLDTSGAPASGPVAVSFRLEGSVGGTPTTWTEAQTVSTVSGAFAASLGASTPIPDALLAADDLVLIATVAGVASAPVPVGWAPRARFAARSASAATADLATTAAALTTPYVGAGAITVSGATIGWTNPFTAGSGVTLTGTALTADTAFLDTRYPVNGGAFSTQNAASAPVACDGTPSHTGRLYFDTTANQLRVCTTAGWHDVGGRANRLGSTQARAGASCKAILDAGDSIGDGMYWIDPDNDGNTSNAFPALCGMTDAGGGWTRCAWTRNTGTTASVSFNAAGTQIASNAGGSSLGTGGTQAIKTACFNLFPTETGFGAAYQLGTRDRGPFDLRYFYRLDGPVDHTARVALIRRRGVTCDTGAAATEIKIDPLFETTNPPLLWLFADGTTAHTCTNGGSSSGIWAPMSNAQDYGGLFLELSDSAFNRLGLYMGTGGSSDTGNYGGTVVWFVR